MSWYYLQEQAGESIPVFMILTKRPQRALELFHNWGLIPDDFLGTTPSGEQLPKNIWFGVTAENQQRADERVPVLLQIPSVVRFVSVEPMLGPVQLQFCPEVKLKKCDYEKVDSCDCCGKGPAINHLDWVICGGESGQNARPVHAKWIESLKDQCEAAEVSFFFKQWGEWVPQTQKPEFIPGNKVKDVINIRLDGSRYVRGIATSGELCCVLKVGKKKAGSLLDGKEYKEWLEVKP